MQKSLVLSIMRWPTSQSQTVHAAVTGAVCYTGTQTSKSNNSGCRAALSIKLLQQLACQIKECLQRSWVLPITWTACLLSEMMLREAGGALVRVVLLLWLVLPWWRQLMWRGVTVATVLLGSACFSPGLCLTVRLPGDTDRKTVGVKKALVNGSWLNETV